MRRVNCSCSNFFFLSGCPGFGTKTAGELAGVESVTYESHVKAVLASRCLACHGEPTRNGAPSSSAMATYETAKALAGQILERTVTIKDMPPGVPLSDDEMGLIWMWVEAGAPEGTPLDNELDSGSPVAADAGMEPPQPAIATYDDDGEEILSQACTFCHGENVAGGAHRKALRFTPMRRQSVSRAHLHSVGCAKDDAATRHTTDR